MNRKAIVSTVEMVATAIALLTAFSIIFPRNVYENNWDRVETFVNGRDLVATMSRLGSIYYYSYNQTALGNFVTGMLGGSIISWSETDGLIKSRLTIACNCTKEQINALNSWMHGMTVNGRNIVYSVCSTNLETINPCESRRPDALVIWNYTTASTLAVETSLLNYLNDGKGMVEIADFQPSFDFYSSTPISRIQRVIFGLHNCTDAGIADCRYNLADETGTIIVPANSDTASYVPYKYFYHVPLTVTSFNNISVSDSTPVPVEGSTPPCSSNSIFDGAFRFYNTNYRYWICNSSTYFDTDNNGIADVRATPQLNMKGWDYRIPIGIDNSANPIDLTDYQILVVLDTTSPIAANKMNTDCGDARFTDTDSSTLLNYWLESGCGTPNTRFWVKVPLVPASSTKTIYLYYGNYFANSESNGNNIFVFFDDFAGSSLNTSKWEFRSLNTGGVLVAGASYTVGDGYVEIDAPDNLMGEIRTLDTFGRNFAVNYKIISTGIQPDGSGKIGSAYGDDSLTNNYRTALEHVTYCNLCIRKFVGSDVDNGGVVLAQNTGVSLTDNMNQLYFIQSVETPEIAYEGYIQGSNYIASSSDPDYSNKRIVLFSSETLDVSIDYVFGRNYALPEPITSTGTEETVRPFFSISGSNFYIKFVGVNNFGISFKPNYRFKEFLNRTGDVGTKLYPIGGGVDNILVNFNYYTAGGSVYPVPLVVLNSSTGQKAAWVADFSRDGIGSVGDDHKMLLSSLILWASDKKTGPPILRNLAIGYTTSYLHTVNDDTFESYVFTLGLGNPY